MFLFLGFLGLAGTRLKVMPAVYSALARLFEVLLPFAVRLYPLLLLDFRFALSLSLLLVALVELLPSTLHVGKQFHDHNVDGVLVLGGIVLGYWLSGPTLFFKLFALFCNLKGNEQINIIQYNKENVPLQLDFQLF